MLSIDFAYDETCSTCHGRAVLTRWNSYKDTEEQIDCPICDGTGYHLTSIGNALLDFLAHHHKRIAAGAGAYHAGYNEYERADNFKSGKDTGDQGGIIPK
jgi:DnaJ-class molecular chaperone